MCISTRKINTPTINTLPAPSNLDHKHIMFLSYSPSHSLIFQGDITTVHSLPVSHRAISHSSSVITISSNVITLQVHMHAAPAIMVPTVGIAMHVQPAHSNQFHHRAVTSTSASHAPWVSTVPPLHLRLQQAPASPLDTTAL